MEARIRSSRALVLLGILLGTLSFFDSGSRALESKQSGLEEATPRPAALGARVAGLRAVIDPETGRRIPESPPRSQLAEGELHSGSSSEWLVVTKPDGSKHLDLHGRFQCGLAVRLTADGRRMFCVDSETDLEDTSRREPGLVAQAEEK